MGAKFYVCNKFIKFWKFICIYLNFTDKFIKDRVETNFRLFMILFIASLTSFEYGYGKLKPNIVVAGDGGSGKSVIGEAVMSLLPEGTCEVVSYQTKRAINTDSDNSNKVLFNHEVDSSLFGILPNGGPISVDSTLKTSLTENVVVTKLY